MNKKIKTRVKGKDIILHADRNLFARMILTAQSRTLDLRTVLAHPLGPMPWSMSTPDGSLRKTAKSALAHTLTNNVQYAESIPTPSACIVDGMSLLQKAKADHLTYLQLAELTMQSALRESVHCDRLDIVFDVYKRYSIKTAERLRRGEEESISVRNITGGQTIHQWRRFLSNSENKTCLIDFLVQVWTSSDFREKFINKEVFVTCGTLCYRLTQDSANQVDELTSNHEEADTRILLHAYHASRRGFKSVVITADDTDILILALAKCATVQCRMYQKTGTAARRQFIDITKVASMQGIDMCSSLIGYHAFTGCDSVSAFCGKGKVKPQKLLMNQLDYHETFGSLGASWRVPNEVFQI